MNAKEYKKYIAKCLDIPIKALEAQSGYLELKRIMDYQEKLIIESLMIKTKEILREYNKRR